MPLDANLLRQLLHDTEGNALDFKQKQYDFTGADDKRKSELLKDILAFVNAWRGQSAYILIGVKERRGKPSEVVGVTEHLDDAALQQFVSSKTQRPVQLSYHVHRTRGGTDIGVVEIPVQERPVWLRKQFGRLASNTVYIRHGSSTSVATPDEIAAMGEARVGRPPPALTLEWADLEQRRPLPVPCTLSPVVLDPLLPGSVFESRPSHYLSVLQEALKDPHAPSPEQAIGHAFWQACLCTLGMVLANRSAVMGKRVLFAGSVKRSDSTHIREWSDRPRIGNPLDYLPPSVLDQSRVDPRVDDHDDRYSITVDFGDIRPGDEIWTTSPLLLTAGISGIVKLKGELRADNLPEPIPCTLPIEFDVSRRPMEREDVAPYLSK